MSIDPGNTFNTAFSFGNLSGNTTQTWRDFVGSNDLFDFYRFTLSNASSFSLILNELSADVDLRLFDGNAIELARSINSGVAVESISGLLSAGTYFVQVSTAFQGANTNYTLNLQGSGTRGDAGNSLLAAYDFGMFSDRTWTFSDAVGASDPDDYYRVFLPEARTLNVGLSNLSADADLQLLDSNGNLISASTNGGDQGESLSNSLLAGVYYLWVSSFLGSNTNYQLTLGDQPLDVAGNSLASAQTITVDGAVRSYSDSVNTVDLNDYYRFTLGSRQNFSLVLDNLSANADVQLLNSSGLTIGSSIRSGTAEDSIHQVLEAGSYYIRVSAISSSVAYRMRVSGVLPQTPSNLLPLEVNVGNLTNLPIAYTGSIGSTDTVDTYRFSLATESNLNASLTGLSADVDIQLVRDANNNRIVDEGEVLLQSERGSSLDEAINTANLAAGDYFFQVYQYSGSSNYTLNLSATPPSPTVQPSNLLPTELFVGSLDSTPVRYSSILGPANSVEVYRFNLANSGNFNAALSGLGTDLDLRLIRDVNNNGIVDAGEEVARSQDVNNADEAINLANLAAGTYFVQVYQYSVATSGYTLTLSTLSNSDPSNLLPAELDVGALGSGPLSFTNTIDNTNTVDVYRFSVSANGTLNAVLSGLSADVDLRLIYDENNNGVVDIGEERGRSELAGVISESLTSNLAAGTYFVQVYQYNGSTSYSLNLFFSPPDFAGKTLDTARLITLGTAPLTFNDYVGSLDANDYYRVALTARSNLNLALGDLDADANVQLLNSRGVILNQSNRSGTADEAMNHTLDAGIYYIRVYPAVGSTNYTLLLSSTAAPPNAVPSNLLPTELDLGVLGPTATAVTGTIGEANTADVIRFRLASLGNLTAVLTGLAVDADLRLLQDGNGNGIVDAGDEIIRSAQDGLQAETLNLSSLAGGTYFIQVYQYSGSGSYTLNLAAPPLGGIGDPGNTLGTAEVQGSAIFSRNQQVSAIDTNDFYRFSLSQSGVFTANLAGLSGDADVRLIQDGNNNGVIDQGEVLAWQWERSTGSEFIRRFLGAGTYFLQVMSYNNQTANYSVATNFTVASSDRQRFAIQINFGLGSEILSVAMRNAVEEAARFWENVISYSSFNGPQTLTIEVVGVPQKTIEVVGVPQNWRNGRGTLASAGPRRTAIDANGRRMPISGVANINSNPEAVAALSVDINYFRRVMIHEFGHVLGLGTLWEDPLYGRNFVNRSTGTYRADTYAGWAYGELLGTFTQTVIPLTTGVGPGSDYSHWREQLFDTELMTHAADRAGMPLSQLTIASLQDLGWYVNYGAAEAYSLFINQGVLSDSPAPEVATSEPILVFSGSGGGGINPLVEVA